MPLVPFTQLYGLPDTLAGYGITDGVSQVTAGDGLAASIIGHSLHVAYAGNGPVTSVAGTVNQVLVNGGISPVAGAVVVSLPNSIAASANNNLTLTAGAGNQDASLVATGTGTASLTGTSIALNGVVTATRANIGTTSTDQIILNNTTAATAGVTAQWSPRMRWSGFGWKSASTATSHQADWIAENQVIPGVSEITSKWTLSSQINSGGYTAILTAASTGVVTIPGSVTSSSYTTGALVVSGGMGIAGQVYTNSTISCAGTLYITGGNNLSVSPFEIFTDNSTFNFGVSGSPEVMQIQSALVFFQAPTYTVGQATVLGLIQAAASSASSATINIPAGTAPTSPNDGDMWYDGTHLKFQNGGTSRTISWV